MEQHRIYRAKTLDKGEWVYGYYVHDVEWAKHYIYRQVHTGVYYQCKPIEVDPKTVGQCTGLKDQSDSIYIYQGDNIQWQNKVWEVDWNDDYAGYIIHRSAYIHGENKMQRLDCDVACESQVLGTIHE